MTIARTNTTIHTFNREVIYVQTIPNGGLFSVMFDNESVNKQNETESNNEQRIYIINIYMCGTLARHYPSITTMFRYQMVYCVRCLDSNLSILNHPQSSQNLRLGIETMDHWAILRMTFPIISKSSQNHPVLMFLRISSIRFEGSARDAWQIIQADPGITQIGQARRPCRFLRWFLKGWVQLWKQQQKMGGFHQSSATMVDFTCWTTQSGVVSPTKMGFHQS